MSKLGILDPLTLAQLKDPKKLPVFFDVVRALLGDRECPVILKKLYAGYVGEEYFNTFVLELKKVEAKFGAVLLGDLPLPCYKTILEMGFEKSELLTNVFLGILRALNSAVECIEAVLEDRKEYSPLRIGDVSIPNFMYELQKTEEDYALIDGKPFWFKLLE